MRQESTTPDITMSTFTDTFTEAAVRSPSLISPTSAEVEAHLKLAAHKHPERVKLLRLGYSVNNRPLLAVEISDRSVPDNQKQHVLIIGGQHGNEESARLVALAAIDHLASDAGAAFLKSQKVVVFPNANPDGCDADTYHNAQGLLINMDHGPDGPRTPEGAAIASLMQKLQPDLYIDCHSCGHTGFGNDIVLYPMTRRYAEDDNILHEMARSMVQAAEKEGIPQYTHSLTWWGDNASETSSTLQNYLRYKTLVFLIENCEDNSGSYPAELRARTGVAKIIAAMTYGQQRDRSCLHAGYANQIVTGLRNLAIVAVGDTAAKRRASRVEAWKQVDRFRLNYVLPLAEKNKAYTLNYTGEPIGPVGVQARITGHWQVDSLTVNGKAMRPSRTQGWHVFTDECSTYVLTTLPSLKAGVHMFNLTLK